MARTSRQERRQRRGIAAGTPPLQPARKPEPALAGGPPASPPARPVANGGDDSRPEQARRGIWGVRFIQEAIAELRKVEWPNQHQVVSGTAVVLVACFIVGVFLYVNDRVWSYLVQHLLLR
jgi:preprotein translocase SecE subunit